MGGGDEPADRGLSAVNQERRQEVEERETQNKVPLTRIGLEEVETFVGKNLRSLPGSELQTQWDNKLTEAFDSGTTQG